MRKAIVIGIGLLLVFIITVWIYIQPNQQVISISDEPYLVIDDKVITHVDSVIVEEGIIYISYDNIY